MHHAQITATEAERVWFERHAGKAGERFEAEPRDYPHICFLAHGTIAEHRVRRVTSREAGSVRLSPPGDGHTVRFGCGDPRCIMIGWHEEVSSLGYRGSAAPLLQHDHASRHFGRILWEELDAGTPSQDPLMRWTAIELVGLLERRPTPRRQRGVPRWLNRVLSVLHETRGAPSHVELARVAQVHPTHLARMFRAQVGRSVGEYVRSLRVQRAARLVLRSSLSLTRIAADAGYADQSHMSRELRRAFGQAPSMLRRAVRGHAN